MKIEIILDGICLSYKYGDFWRVVFFCDATHEANFDNPATGKPASLGNGRDRNVTFDPAPNGPPSEGNGFKQIFNMSEEYAHGVDPNMEPYLNVAPNIPSDLQFVQLDIPNAIMALKTTTKNEYWVQPIEPAGHPVTLIGRVASTVSVTFDVTGVTKMKVTNPAQEYEIPYKPNTTKTISFNNDCGNLCHDNDFTYLYEWLEDRRSSPGKEYRFFAGQTLDRPTAIKSLRKLEKASPTYGNCDPAVSEPPPTGP